VNDLTDIFKQVTGQISLVQLAKLIVQIFIISYALAWIWKRIVGTQAERLVKGVLVLIVICVISAWLEFKLITSILESLIPVFVMALMIVFQPEIRRGLGYLGKVQTFRLDLSIADSGKNQISRNIDQIITAVRELSRNKVGALIVVEPPEGERDYVSPGTPVNADISATLLLTIFFGNSPLHDGAVVIRQDKIVAAGVILPMTDNPKLSYRYGTRHRAAIGLSEIYDGLCIVVSEETGSISAASRGMLARYNSAEELADPIAYLYNQGADDKAPGPLNSFLALFGRTKREETAQSSKEFPTPTLENEHAAVQELQTASILEQAAPSKETSLKKEDSKKKKSTKSADKGDHPAPSTESADRPETTHEDTSITVKPEHEANYS
jgi:diadenylate cyclase